MSSTSEKRKPKTISHGPTVNAIKRAKYEAKQEQRLQQSSARHWSSWFNGREEYAAFITAQDVREIRQLRGEIHASAIDEERTIRLIQIADWILPFFDLKETPALRNGNERLFVSEGTEAVRMMVQQCAGCTDSFGGETLHGTESTPPPIRLLSILSKPSAFFDSPTHLLHDIQGRNQLDGSSEIPPFKIVIADEEAMSEIAGFRIARGAMACGIIPDYMQRNGYSWLKGILSTGATKFPTMVIPTNKPIIRRLLALDAISNTANMGSIIRTAAALSIDAIILSDDSCDAWYRQSVRTSMGHVITVPIIRISDWENGRRDDEEDNHDDKLDGLANILRWLRETMDVECLAAVVDDDSDKKHCQPFVLLEDQAEATRSWCCVLGNEGNGIRDIVIQECNKRVKIGMATGVDSLSLPIAAGILMHGLSAQTKKATGK
jgi:tRNA G18 (ribose-2'-O)-methylase SpoU